MPKPAFFVDGYTEKLALERICKGAAIVRLNTNGKDVKIATIAKAIHLNYKILGNKCFPIVVLVDREGRSESYSEVKDVLVAEMTALDLPIDQFHVGVCDRMIENWIVSDLQLMEREFGTKPNLTEGMSGKGYLKKLFGRDRVYQETTHGVDLLVRAKASNISQNSQSFKSFAENFPVECHWLGR